MIYGNSSLMTSILLLQHCMATAFFLRDQNSNSWDMKGEQGQIDALVTRWEVSGHSVQTDLLREPFFCSRCVGGRDGMRIILAVHHCSLPPGRNETHWGWLQWVESFVRMAASMFRCDTLAIHRYYSTKSASQALHWRSKPNRYCSFQQSNGLFCQ